MTRELHCLLLDFDGTMAETERHGQRVAITLPLPSMDSTGSGMRI